MLHLQIITVNWINLQICILLLYQIWPLHECVQHFNIHDKLVLHTAGSVSKDVLKNISYNYGVLYPLQSLRKESHEIPEIPFLVDGNNDWK